MRLMIAIDDSEASQRALEFVSKFVSDEADEILVLTVQSPVSSSAIAWTGLGLDPALGFAGFGSAGQMPVPRPDASVSADLVEKAVEDVDGDEALVEPGDVVRTIVGVAEENDVDLIVVGSSGKGLIARFLTGSVSHALIDEASCPVLVVAS